MPLTLAGPKDVSEQASTIISMVPASAHVRDVYVGTNGILDGLAKLGKLETNNTLCIDESTIEQSESRRVAAMIRARGADMIDAPVFGGEDISKISSFVSVAEQSQALLVLETLH